MKRLTRPTPATWTARLKPGEASHPSGERPFPFAHVSRPGIAARWKPRDRVSVAAN